MIDVVYSKFKLKMFWQIFSFVVLNIWNFYWMNVNFTCVNDRISYCKNFSHKTKCSNCYSVNMTELIFLKTIFIKSFYINTQICPDSCFKALTGNCCKCLAFWNSFWASSKEDFPSLWLRSLNDEFKVDLLSNRN